MSKIPMATEPIPVAGIIPSPRNQNSPPSKKSSKPSMKRWIVFLLSFLSFLFMISSTIMKNVGKWFDTTKQRLIFQFSCNKNPFTDPLTIPLTAKSPYVSQLNKNKDFTYDLGLADFFYIGSAKSYQLGGNTQSIPSTDAIKDVLNQGARVIELDIFADYNDVNKPVVRGQSPTLFTMDNYLEVGKCFDTLNQHGWKNSFSNYPLILYLNLNSGKKELLDSLATIFKSKFGSKMIDNRKYGSAAVLPEYILMKDCVSKLILIVNITNTELEISDTQPLTSSPDFDTCINCFFCSNKDPKKSSREIIELELSDEHDIQSAYNKSMMSSSLLNLSDLMEHNKENMSISTPFPNYDMYNIAKQEYDLKSYDIIEPQIHGCQINLFHFNLVDTNLNRALTIFKTGPVQLRPQYLRKMPLEGIDIVDANPDTSFADKQLNVLYQGLNFNQNNTF